MKKLVITIGGGILAIAYAILFAFLMSQMLDRGGWWIAAGVAAILLNYVLMRYYFGESNVFEVDGGFPTDITVDGDNSPE